MVHWPRQDDSPLANPDQTDVMVSWVRVQVPVRVLDAGGWTDTWFARRGRVCNLAVGDGVEVTVKRVGRGDSPTARTVDLHLPSFSDRYRFSPDDSHPGRHPLVETTLREWVPSGDHVEVEVASSVPPGSGLGTSASVVVGLIAALQALNEDVSEPSALAEAAHHIETLRLGWQSGVQDQIAAACGGATLIEIDPYPVVHVQSVEVSPQTWDALALRTLTVYLGASHRSSHVHRAVISRLEVNDDHGFFLEPLRAAARQAADALVAGDLGRYGEAMIANTTAQAALHPALVNSLAREVIEMARRHSAVGWKVNGAGGEGGTVTIVTSDDPGGMRDALQSVEWLTVLPLRPAREGAGILEMH